MPIAVNDQGEALFSSDGQTWKPAQIAENDKGERKAFDGDKWVDLAPKKPALGVGEQAARVAGNFGGGFNRSALETVAALPELVSSGMRGVGLPAPERGFYTNKLQSGLDAVIGAPPKPEGGVEKFAHGAGRGVADAMSIAMPAARVAQTAQGPVTRAVAQQLASAPVAQSAYGALGGGVGEATDSPVLGTATALAGPLAAGLARNAMTAGARLNPEQQRLAQVLRAEGIGLTAAQATGSAPLKAIDASFEMLPFTAGRARQGLQDQADQFTSAVLRRSGETATEATPQVVNRARARIGADFDRLVQGRTVTLGKPVTDALDDVATAQDSVRGLLDTSAIDQLVKGARARLAQSNTLPGEAAQTIRSELTKEIKSSTNNRLRDSLRSFRDSIDDSIRDSLPTQADRDAWNTARRQWANLKVAEKAVTGAGEGAALGTVTPNALRGAVTSASPRDYAAGAGELNDLARAGQAFLRPVPDSGTARRTFYQNLLTGGMLSGAGAAGVAAGAPTAGAAALASLLLPKVAQTAIHSQAGTRALSNPNANANTAVLMGKLLAAREKDAALRGR